MCLFGEVESNTYACSFTSVELVNKMMSERRRTTIAALCWAGSEGMKRVMTLDVCVRVCDDGVCINEHACDLVRRSPHAPLLAFVFVIYSLQLHFGETFPTCRR
uniref:Uncharacterized protein n=1 Tax=Craspedostauros australis TaxID=1486917 RepID=A0A7R9ZIK5_9STRA|mmetsp:Transcript_12664/g.34943  ORF Transcript_12664/g.34943 Transcript_12664/m.34943 type:complete len:104 (+) Transcript_12664:76-387(+)